MATNEERMRILKMLEAGQISAEEAAELLAALGEQAEGVPAGKERKARWFPGSYLVTGMGSGLLLSALTPTGGLRVGSLQSQAPRPTYRITSLCVAPTIS